MKHIVLPALLLAIVTGSAADFLVRVETDPAHTAQSVAEAGLEVLAQLDSSCLAQASAADIDRLSSTFSMRMLDENPSQALYVYVMTEPGFDRAGLSAYGRVLTEDASGVLLRTTEADVERLNQLPVELYRLSMRPMVFAPVLAPKPAAVPDSLIWLVVNRVSQDTLEANLRRLIGFYTRYTTTESCYRAMMWARERLSGLGCDSTYIDTFRNGYAPNVVGIKNGTVNPRRIYIVCGHMDNTSELAPGNFAPGSDDNASGAGTVLEVARVFADLEFDNTVWFVLFSGEEQGLVGSDSFAYGCRQRGDSIALAINFDMVSYGRDDSATVVWTSALPQTESLAHFFLAQADTFTDLKAKDTLFRTANSDHASFWKYGYLAIRGRYHDRTPAYHTTGDTIGPFHYTYCGTNNLPLYTEVVKATAATLAKLAGAHRNVGAAETPDRALVAGFDCFPTVGRPPFCVNLPRPARSGIELSDVAGRTVRVLHPDGGLRVVWDGRLEDGAAAQPGVYFIHQSGFGPAPTRKLILAE